MHLGRVVAPDDEHVTLVEVLVAACRFIDAVRADISGDRRGHAQPGVGLDVVVT
jgi:hypothetical protein